MPRLKVDQKNKRRKITITIDKEISEMLDEYMKIYNYDIGEKSKLIEKFIRNNIEI